MPQYLVANYLPDNFDPSTQDEATVEAIHALNREMIAAGVRKFAGGLGSAHTLRPQPSRQRRSEIRSRRSAADGGSGHDLRSGHPRADGRRFPRSACGGQRAAISRSPTNATR